MPYVVERKPLTLLERIYIPQILAGMRVTLKHMFQPNVTLEYPEQRPAIPPGYRGVPTLVMDPNGREKCVSCQLCEFVCPPKAIRITPPGDTGLPADRTNAEKMPAEFEINMLRCIFCGFCQEVCPEEAIFLQKDYSLTGTSRKEMIYNKEKLLSLGGISPGIQKWKLKLDETKAQENFPVKL